MASTADLRRQQRRQRRALSTRAQMRHAIAVARHLAHYRRFRQARHIAAYWASDGELSLAPTIERALARGQRIYLPVINQRPLPSRPGRLRFMRYTAKQRLHRNRFGIPEPASRGSHPCIAPRHLDLVLLPMVGFDVHRNRLGMGGGFYDRTFAYRNRTPASLSPRLIGIAHTCQRLALIEARAWDVQPDAICTEAGGTWSRRLKAR